jgi:hypothetical protein
VKRLVRILIRFNIVIASGGCAKAAYFSLVFAGALDAIPLVIVWLLTWQIYTLDRVIKQPEDKLTLRRSVEELVFMQKQAKWFKRLLVLTFVAMGVLFLFRPYALIGVAIGIGGGLMYSLRIPLAGKRIKQIPLIKSVYVPAILVAYCFITPWVFPQTAMHWVVVALMVLAFGINVSLFDLRDADRDKSAGIVTVANFFGKRGLLIGIWPVTVGITALLLWDRSPAMIAAVAGVWAVTLSSLRLWKTAPMWYYALIIDGTMVVPLAVYLALTAAN